MKYYNHNIFAVPMLTPTFGITQWTKEELVQLDIKTTKLLTISGSFHKNSDIERLYTIVNKKVEDSVALSTGTFAEQFPLIYTYLIITYLRTNS